MGIHRLVLCLGWLLAGPCLGVPYVEEFRNLKIDWSRLRVHFTGRAASHSDLSLNALESQAIQNGLLLALEDVALFHDKSYQILSEHLVLGKNSPEAKTAAEQLTTVSYTRSHFFWPDSRLEVALEAPLGRALLRSSLAFLPDTFQPRAGPAGSSGVILGCDGPCQPTPVYRVIDGEQRLIAGIGNMRRADFVKSLMGRWFQDPTPGEVRGFVGSDPLHLKVRQIQPGVLQTLGPTPQNDTIAHVLSALVEGRVVISMPADPVHS